jgi:chloride channel protein, CIC family
MGDPANGLARARALLRGWLGAAADARALRSGLALLLPDAPLELRIVGRVLLHAAIVGVAAGLVGAAFFAALEAGQRLLLEGAAGFTPLRARGEEIVGPAPAVPFRPWLLAFIPALGALASGLLTHRFAPEAAGGGGDAVVEAYHRGGVVRWRVIPVKAAAAVAALSSGGSGGREGPTMHIGAAIGALVGRFLPASRSERRILIVAGVAAGIAAVFRTPLGAALLATELLYRDDFEADALVPAILASVVSYSIVIAAFGETALFGVPGRFPFRPGHLPLYAALALVVSLAAVLFVRALRGVQGATLRLRLPPWARPAAGGLAVGLLGTAVALLLEARHGAAARGFGVLGGGYGVVQAALDSAAWFPGGAELVLLLIAVALAKIVASALTIGSGAAAGDFAPSLVIGALVGSAFGHAAAAITGDPTIRPAAFALVGMGTFYGGVAHVPLSALVLVAELAGSYDLLVPMMLAIGISFVALRRWSLYPSQPAGRAQSPIHRGETIAPPPALSGSLSRAVLAPSELPEFPEGAPLEALARAAADATHQRVALVRGADGTPRGLVELSLLSLLSPAELGWTRAADAMVPFASVELTASWSAVVAVLQQRGISQVPAVEGREVVGWAGYRELIAAVAPGEPARIDAAAD